MENPPAWHDTGLEITHKIRVSFRETKPRNWVSLRFLGFPFGKPKFEFGFPEILPTCYHLKQSLFTLHFTCFLLSSYLGDANSNYNCLGQNKSFPTVYNMPMFMPICQGFLSENLAQNLYFLHHFWVSRKSGNPVISSPATIISVYDDVYNWWDKQITGSQHLSGYKW